MAKKSSKQTKKDLAKFDGTKPMYKSSEGRWVTINGRHKFIPGKQTPKKGR